MEGVDFVNTYDEADHLTTIRDPDGETAGYLYDQVGQAKHVSGTKGSVRGVRRESDP